MFFWLNSIGLRHFLLQVTIGIWASFEDHRLSPSRGCEPVGENLDFGHNRKTNSSPNFNYVKWRTSLCVLIHHHFGGARVQGLWFLISLTPGADM